MQIGEIVNREDSFHVLQNSFNNYYMEARFNDY